MSWRYLLPILAFAALAGFLAKGLFLNPREIPSALIDKPVPTFDLPALHPGGEGLSSETLKQGQPAIVNIFASWCTPCRAEHPQLMALSNRLEVPIYGINYKDKKAAGRRFLNQLGDPYDAIGVDADGRLGIDLGVYGVPETYVVDGRGIIRFKHVGPMTPDHVERKLLPAVAEAWKTSRREGA